MAVVDNHYGNLMDGLVVVDPRVEQGIDQGHDNEEDEHALVLDDLSHLLTPDVAGILNAFDDGMYESVFHCL